MFARLNPMSLLGGLFSRPAAAAGMGMPPRPAQPVYVIGDIHGRDDLLEVLLARIDADSRARPRTIVCVGDYLDRGEQSRAVLERLHARVQAEPGSFICLMGNHEKMMLEFLDAPQAAGPRWLRNGGLQTLASFRCGDTAAATPEARLTQLHAALAAALPEALQHWLRHLPLHWCSGNLWVVHAGADPALPLAGQDAGTLLWGHPEFLTRARQDGAWVAHGHTILAAPQAQAGRIGVDTGAYYSGRLTAARVDPSGEVRFLQS